MLSALGELRGVDLQLPVERQVVGQRQELADHDQGNDGQKRPEHNRVQRTRLHLLDRRHDGGGRYRQIRQQQAGATWRTVCRRTVCRRAERRRRGRAKRRDRDQQVTGDPTRIDDIAGAVPVGGGQIGETAVRQQVGHQSAGEQIERQASGPGGTSGEDHDHGADDHVAHGVGEADQVGNRAARAGSIDGTEDRRPADDEERARDQQAIQNGAGQRHGSRWGRREAQHRGDGEWDSRQIPEVGKRWERHLLSFDELEVRPGDLTGAPGECGGGHQRPGDTGAALMPNRGQGARRRRQERDQEFADVIELLGGFDAAPTEHQPGREK